VCFSLSRFFSGAVVFVQAGVCVLCSFLGVLVWGGVEPVLYCGIYAFFPPILMQ
jgi:hypothetical protein